MSIKDVIERAIRELDLAAKVELLTGAAAFALHGNDAIGLRPMIFSDGPTGVRGSEFVGGKRVALFPNATLLAQSWDETAAQRVGEMLAGEGRSQGVDVVLGPTVNLHRSPLGGRLFEALDDHGCVQHCQWSGRHRPARAEQWRTQGRVGLGWAAHVGLGRDEDCCAGCKRRI